MTPGFFLSVIMSLKLHSVVHLSGLQFNNWGQNGGR